MKIFKTYIIKKIKSLFWKYEVSYIDKPLGIGRLDLCKLHKFKKYIELEAKICRRWNLYDILESIESLIEEITCICCVLRTVSKISWVECSFDIVRKTFIYTDIRYIIAHKIINQGLVQVDEFFSISIVNSSLLGFTNLEFWKKIKAGVCTYIESQVVLNTPIFAIYDLFGRQVLTSYARKHIEQCELIFKLVVKNSDGECYTLKKDKKLIVDYDIVYLNGYENSTPEKQNKILQKTITEHYEIYTKLNQNYAESLKICKKWRGISNLEIAKRCNINHETVGRCLKGEATSLNTIILICLALHLPPIISKKIIQDSPYNLLISNVNHQWYDFILTYKYSKELDEIREFCTINNIEYL